MKEATATKEPVIYLTCFPTGGGSGWVCGSTVGGDVIAHALAEDGTGLGSHLSSSVGFAKHDIGLTSDWHHEDYREHYPSGYRVEWVEDPDTHEGWRAAFALNQQQARQAVESGANADVQAAGSQ